MAQAFGVTGETLAKYAEVEGKAVTVDIIEFGAELERYFPREE